MDEHARFAFIKKRDMQKDMTGWFREESGVETWKSFPSSGFRTMERSFRKKQIAESLGTRARDNGGSEIREQVTLIV